MLKGKVQVYLIYSNFKFSSDFRQKELETVASVNTTGNYNGWLEVNVTDALNKWLMNKNSNNGLYLSAHVLDKPDHEVKLDNVGLVNTKGDDEYQPFMVGFFSGQQVKILSGATLCYST